VKGEGRQKNSRKPRILEHKIRNKSYDEQAATNELSMVDALVSSRLYIDIPYEVWVYIEAGSKDHNSSKDLSETFQNVE